MQLLIEVNAVTVEVWVVLLTMVLLVINHFEALMRYHSFRTGNYIKFTGQYLAFHLTDNSSHLIRRHYPTRWKSPIRHKHCFVHDKLPLATSLLVRGLQALLKLLTQPHLVSKPVIVHLFNHLVIHSRVLP